MIRYTKWTLAREIVMWVCAVIMLLPFYLLVNTALKTPADAIGTPAFEPALRPTFDSFIAIFQTGGTSNIFVGLFNSAVITAGAVIGLIVVGGVTAYVLTRRLSRVSTWLYYLILAGIVVPAQLGLVPLYIGARTVGLLGSPLGMAVIYVAMLTPLAVFLYGGFIRALPTEYEEAATIDGASPLRTYVQVVFPLLSPATGTIAILTGLIVWNDFFTPLIFLNGSDSATLPVVVYSYVNGIIVQWNNIFAVLIVALLPITVLYLIMQKKFIQGFSGGLKS
ncbi:carbohydrate ABC transporter permease [Pseudolysinimonas yzui]|uniref:Sugar ABC transporter permease n=1 Tax=Pseudolysinimonas yzui TaxID=2708254 RepID=A0A8J3GQN6_9MICO|nr:carbohydrate ABC transporter permease [Pseudolysinimonas yzui]GHF16032.1 sugar ABC transporter permease [Pseudolysinimonas yzui]